MNKFLWLILLTGLAVLLAGCATSAEEAPSATPLATLPAIEPQLITTAEAYALVDSGEAVLVDTRSVEEYQVQHAAGAVPFPEADVVARYGELPTDEALIFY